MLSVFERAGFDVRRRERVRRADGLARPPPERGRARTRIDARDHLGAVASLRPILAPASRRRRRRPEGTGRARPRGAGQHRRRRLPGVVTPVNRADGVRSMRAVRSLAELDAPPELVVIAVPADEVPEVAAEAGGSGAKALLVLIRRLRRRRDARAARARSGCSRSSRSAGLRMVGPNCLGVLNTDPEVQPQRHVRRRAGVPPAASRSARSPAPSGIGAARPCRGAAARRLELRVARRPRRRLHERPARAVGGGRAHGRGDALRRDVRQPRALRAHRPARLAPQADPRRQGPPSGAARRARRRRGSHTAAALRGDEVVDALLRQAGVLRFHSGEELFDAAEFFESQPLPRGRRVGDRQQLHRAWRRSPPTRCARWRRQLAGRPRNPLVLGIQAPGRRTTPRRCRGCSDDAGVDARHGLLRRPRTAATRARCSRRSPRAAAGSRKPVVASVVGADGHLPATDRRACRTSCSPSRAPPCWRARAERRAWLSRPLGQPPSYDDLDADAARALVAARLERGRSAAGWRRGRPRRCWPPTASRRSRRVRCADADAAVAAAAALGGPIALKADFPPPAHAGDIDAVLLGLAGEAAVRGGLARARAPRAGRRARVDRRDRASRWSAPGADVLVGAVGDPDLGPVMAIGSGRPPGRAWRAPPRSACRRRPTSRPDELIDASESVADPARRASAAARRSTARPCAS